MTKKRRRKICRLNGGKKVVRSEGEKGKNKQATLHKDSMHSKNMSGDSDADSS
jgi:hypothetical protein